MTGQCREQPGFYIEKNEIVVIDRWVVKQAIFECIKRVKRGKTEIKLIKWTQLTI